jgi:hypothetical protein
MGSTSRDSCQELLKNLEVLPLQFRYIFSLLWFVVKNRELLRSNSDIHNINRRYNSEIHLPIANLTVFQKRVILFWN